MRSCCGFFLHKIESTFCLSCHKLYFLSSVIYSYQRWPGYPWTWNWCQCEGRSFQSFSTREQTWRVPALHSKGTGPACTGNLFGFENFARKAQNQLEEDGVCEFSKVSSVVPKSANFNSDPIELKITRATTFEKVDGVHIETNCTPIASLIDMPRRQSVSVTGNMIMIKVVGDEVP